MSTPLTYLAGGLFLAMALPRTRKALSRLFWAMIGVADHFFGISWAYRRLNQEFGKLGILQQSFDRFMFAVFHLFLVATAGLVGAGISYVSGNPAYEGGLEVALGAALLLLIRK